MLAVVGREVGRVVLQEVPPHPNVVVLEKFISVVGLRVVRGAVDGEPPEAGRPAAADVEAEDVLPGAGAPDELRRLRGVLPELHRVRAELRPEAVPGKVTLALRLEDVAGDAQRLEVPLLGAAPVAHAHLVVHLVHIQRVAALAAEALLSREDGLAVHVAGPSLREDVLHKPRGERALGLAAVGERRPPPVQGLGNIV